MVILIYFSFSEYFSDEFWFFLVVIKILDIILEIILK